MKCPKCGGDQFRQMDSGYGSFTSGTDAKGHRVIRSHSSSDYQCLKCGYIEHLESEHSTKLKVTHKWYPYVGIVEETEIIQDDDNANTADGVGR